MFIWGPEGKALGKSDTSQSPANDEKVVFLIVKHFYKENIVKALFAITFGQWKKNYLNAPYIAGTRGQRPWYHDFFFVKFKSFQSIRTIAGPRGTIRTPRPK